jgi:hypothetical protein
MMSTPLVASSPAGPGAWEAHAERMRQRFGGASIGGAPAGGLLTGNGGLTQGGPLAAPSPSLLTRRGNAPGLFSSKLHNTAPSAAASPRDAPTAGNRSRAEESRMGGVPSTASIAPPAAAALPAESTEEHLLPPPSAPPPDRSAHALSTSEATSSARTGALAAVRREAARLAAELGIEAARRKEADAALLAERAAAHADVQRLSARVVDLVRARCGV